MMFSQGFTASLKVGGKILRETNGTVSLPFNSEYSVLLKNKLSRRAMVKVEVDGQDATDGTKLILPANGSIDLERFIKNGNLKAGNKFKFIERTSKIEDHRGIKEDDGLIRAEFWAEKEVVDVPEIRRHYYDEWYPVRRGYPHWDYYYPYWPSQPQILCNTTTTSGLGGQYNVSGGSVGNIQSGSRQMVAMNCSQGAASGGRLLRSASAKMSADFDSSLQISEASLNDAGITVPGSKSDQQFQSSYGFQTESNSHVIVLQLKGFVGDKPVVTPVTVDRKPVCPTCGTVNKPQNKFCKECGTGLQLI